MPDDDEDESAEEPFSERLLQAFAHLSDERKEGILRRMEEEGIPGGLKAGIARLAGIKTPSLLSDMLAGRAKGRRYQEALAGLLGVSHAWLNGDDAAPPDWALPPIEAYERWLLKLRRAWKDWFGAPVAEGSVSRSVDGPILGDETRWQPLQIPEADRRAIGQRLLLAHHDPVLADLITGRWELVPFPVLMRTSEIMGVEPPDHLETIRRGHGQAAEATRQQDWIVKRLTQRLRRYWLPPQLFQAARLALVTLRQQRAYQDKDVTDLDDCLELLWRQQYQQQGDTPQRPPAAFTGETGRETWTRLSEIRGRYGAEEVDPEEKYRSHGPFRREEAGDAD